MRTCCLWLVVATSSLLLTSACGKKRSASVPTPEKSETRVAQNLEVAQIIRSSCADCHRPDGGAPFSLLSNKDISKRAAQIAEVTESGYMPPWPPDSQANTFVGERKLSDDQILAIREWANTGGSLGHSDATPQTDTDSNREWSLGTPDLIVSLDEPYVVPAEETEDIYRNFVIAIPVAEPHYVNAIEIRPSNMLVAHHLFVRTDSTGAARELASSEGQIGFPGMERPSSVRAPDGCILSWQVGKQPSPEPDGVAWRLEPGMDFVVECHLQPTGKRELVDLEIGLHFTDTPPSRFPVLVNMRQLNLDIAAGDSNYRASMEYTLPVAAVATAVLPHAHYLGRELNGYAVLPSGERTSLIRIPEWNFNWQGEYRYHAPLQLPAGTKLVMDYQFDNSSANPLNPHHPPKRVKYGPRSTDEMAELALQLIPGNKADRDTLVRHMNRWRIEKESIPYNLRRIAEDGIGDDDLYKARMNLGKAFFAIGKLKEAAKYLVAAGRSPLADAEAFYYLGRLSVIKKDLNQAAKLFEQGLKLDPTHIDSLNGLGMVCLQTKEFRLAAAAFKRAIQQQPNDSTLHYNLGISQLQRRDYQAALSSFSTAHKINPNNTKAKLAAEKLRERLNR